MSTVIIAHANCMDGLGAAWAVHKAHPDATVHYAHYDDAPIEVVDSDVFIVDFSYPRQTVLALAAKNESVTVLDHHRTAKAELENLTAPNLTVVFDMNRSGAQIAWDYCHQKTRPFVINYIGDRDLWKFQLPYSKEVSALLAAREPTFDWLEEAELALIAQSPGFFAAAAAIYSYQETQAKRQAKKFTAKTDKLGRRYGLANIVGLGSESADQAMKSGNFDYVAYYFDKTETNQRVFSLRARDTVDVSAIAKQHGGGGHANAAGFTVDLTVEDPLQAEPVKVEYAGGTEVYRGYHLTVDTYGYTVHLGAALIAASSGDMGMSASTNRQRARQAVDNVCQSSQAS